MRAKWNPITRRRLVRYLGLCGVCEGLGCFCCNYSGGDIDWLKESPSERRCVYYVKGDGGSYELE